MRKYLYAAIIILCMRLTLGRMKRSKDEVEVGKRLWIIDQYAVPPTQTGFTRQYEHAELLTSYGWQTSIFATPFDHKRRIMTRSVGLRRPVLPRCEEGVEFIWLYTVPYSENDWRRYVNMASFLLFSVLVGFFRQAPSVILASSPHLFTGLAGWLLAKRHRVPFILEIRDLWPESLVQLGLSNQLLIKFLGWLEVFLYKRADLIVALTEGIQSGIKAKGFGSQKITMVPNASLRPSPVDERKRQSRRLELGWEGKTVAIWVGAHGRANGLDVIVEAARKSQRCNGLHFVLVGDGPDKPRLTKSANGLMNIEFIDSVSKSDVEGILRAADIGLLVHRDTLAVKGARPNKLFDYMAASLPIITNMAGEAHRLIDEARCGVYVPAEDSIALAKAAQELHHSPDQRISLGSRGFEHVMNVHSREEMAWRLSGALTKVLSNQGIA